MKPLTHEKLMQEEGLTAADLPIDAQTALNKLKKTLRGIKLTESQGRKVGQHIYNEVEMLDKVIAREILDAKGGKTPPPTPPPADPPAKTPAEIAAEKKANEDAEAERLKAEEESRTAKDKEDADRQKDIQDALAKKTPTVNKELKTAIEAGTETIALDELKTTAPATYSVIFENYEQDAVNGIETSSYSCIETGPGTGKFTLSKI